MKTYFKDFSEKLFKIQICDCLAHNPEKNTSRLAYIDTVNNLLTINQSIKQ